MIWDHYIPLAVAGGRFNGEADRQGSTILDFAGMSPQRLTGELEPLIQHCVGSGAKYLLVNIDDTNLMHLMETVRGITLAPLAGAVPPVRCHCCWTRELKTSYQVRPVC